MLQINYKSVDELHAYENNSRTHSPEQIKQLERSIEEFGFTNPILVNENDKIIAGHGRLMAAKNLGIDEVPAICIEGLSEAQYKALVIADNKLALNAGWDMDALKLEMEELGGMEYDLSLTGFFDDELDTFFKDDEEKEVNDISDSLETSFKIEIECRDEMEQEDLFTRFQQEGLKCRILTL